MADNDLPDGYQLAVRYWTGMIQYLSHANDDD